MFFETTWPLLIHALSLYLNTVSGFREDFVVVLIPVEEVKKWYSLSLSLSRSLSLSLSLS